MLKVVLDDKAAVAVLTGLTERIGPGRVLLMRHLAEYEVASVRRTIDEHGIGGAWPPLSPLSRQGEPLHDTGALIAGIQVGVATAEAAEVISSKKTEGGIDYPAVQNYGMTIKAKQRWVRFNVYEGRVSGAMSWVGPDGTRYFAMSVTIPPRPFMVFRPEDPEGIEQQAKLFLFGEAGL